ncbi:hypothetical protein DFH07DRAFT_869858 [Mycena maculata]|uniref:Tetratricopeptide repeat protein 39B n=1 Tax=Mycena maculata TaxID=230809 RepID=A0AAD7ILB6_9AGAR|nr:hypothetical protein DFH07DRAFT_869858 [Mycena maculata]
MRLWIARHREHPELTMGSSVSSLDFTWTVPTRPEIFSGGKREFFFRKKCVLVESQDSSKWKIKKRSWLNPHVTPDGTGSYSQTGPLSDVGYSSSAYPLPRTMEAPTSPPPVKLPYNPADALEDLPCVRYALDLFLASKMHESEDYMNQSDKKKQRLYFATGYGLIQCVKGLMSYADEDLLDALGHTKQGVLVATQHRKKAPYLASRLAGYVVSSLNTTGVNFIKTMTDVERHAELVYAESLFEKALLGIVYSGDWLAFIKEALNMRTIITIYRTLYKYVCAVDAEYTAEMAAKNKSLANGRSTAPLESPAIDAHFRSGVYLGAGMSSLIVSLLPARLLSVVELFGYAADRAEALEILGRAGGWGRVSAAAAARAAGASAFTLDVDHNDEDVPPTVGTEEEGVRRSICDMTLLIFHLVMGSFTFDCVDVPMAARIVKWNLKRYPEGVFFLFGAGRLALARSQPAQAIEFYSKAMAAQSQYRNLHHISYWEMAIANLALGEVSASLGCWRYLQKEATWSKSMYSYGMAVCLLESTEDGEEKRKEEARTLMETVPGLRQKIAGKSIPLEKFVARKARKFIAQGNRLALPALEMSYVFFAIAHAPRAVVEGRMLPQVRAQLAALDAPGAEKEKAMGYWDDYCLARFLEGVCLRYVAFPDPDAVLDPAEVVGTSRDEAAAGGRAAFEAVFENGPQIELDHHLVYHAHYELGRLLACMGNEPEARRHFELVLSGKYLEVGPSGRKNALHMRTNAALEALHLKRL